MDTKITTWWRFRVRDRAAGPGEWSYLRANDAEWAREYAENEHRDYMESEGFRGLDVEPVDAPPLEWLVAEAQKLTKRQEGLRAELERLRDEIKNHETELAKVEAARLSADLRAFPWFISAGVGQRDGVVTVFVYVSSSNRAEVDSHVRCSYPVLLVPTRHPAPAGNVRTLPTPLEDA